MQARPPLVCSTAREKLRFARDPVNYLLEHGTRDDVTRMQLPVYGVGTTEYVVVSEPSLARRVLADDEAFEQYSDIAHAMPFDNPFGSPNDDDIEWPEKRAAYVDALTGAPYRRVVEVAERQVGEDVAALETGRWHDASRLFRRLALRMMARVLLGTTPPPEVEARIERAAGYGLAVTNLGLSSFLPIWTPRRSLFGFWRQGDPIGEWVTDAIRTAPEDALVWTVADDLGLDADDDRLEGTVLFPLVAGFVSPEVMLSSTLDLLGSHPDERGRVAAAAAELPTPPRNRDLVDVRTDLRWPLFEALRLFPPTFFLTRRATRDVALGGYDVAAGEHVWVDQWSLGRRPDHWDDPGAFDPGRWADLSPRRDAFLPFGDGDRACIGVDVSFLQGELALANLFGRYEVEIRAGGVAPGTVSGGMSLDLPAPELRLAERG